MNVYQVVSEDLTTFGSYERLEPPEPYRIVELVGAPSRGRAKYLAWKADGDSYTGDIRDMPKMSVALIQKDFPVDEGLLSEPLCELWDPPFRQPWRVPYVRIVDAFIAGAYEYQFDDSWWCPE